MRRQKFIYQWRFPKKGFGDDTIVLHYIKEFWTCMFLSCIYTTYCHHKWDIFCLYNLEFPTSGNVYEDLNILLCQKYQYICLYLSVCHPIVSFLYQLLLVNFDTTVGCRQTHSRYDCQLSSADLRSAVTTQLWIPGH